MNAAANAATINHASFAAIKAELQTIASLAGHGQEALQATPEGEALPKIVAHALALIQELAGVLANDVDAAMEQGALRAN